MTARLRTRARTLILLVAVAQIASFALSRIPAGPTLSWETNLERGLITAAQIDRNAVLFFDAAWCSVCDRFERRTLRSPAVAAALERFVRIRVDVSALDDRTERLLASYGVRGFPSLVFVDQRGQPIEGSRTQGFIDPEALLTRISGWEPQLAGS